jgi:hypothetical protein
MGGERMERLRDGIWTLVLKRCRLHQLHSSLSRAADPALAHYFSIDCFDYWLSDHKWQGSGLRSAALGDVTRRIDVFRPKPLWSVCGAVSIHRRRAVTMAFTRAQLRIYGSDGQNGAATNK